MLTKPQKNKRIAAPDDIGRTAGRTQHTSEGVILDADLAALIDAWPAIPANIRAAITALVGIAAPSRPLS